MFEFWHVKHYNTCTYTYIENDVQLVGLIQSIITPDNLGSEADGETEAATTASAVGHINVHAFSMHMTT